MRTALPTVSVNVVPERVAVVPFTAGVATVALVMVTLEDVVVPDVPMAKAVPSEPSKEILITFPPQPPSAAADTALLKPVKEIVSTLKTAEPLDQLSVIALVIDVSHAIAGFDPCPNSSAVPPLILTLAAKVVATSGPIVAIKSPAIIFLVR